MAPDARFKIQDVNEWALPLMKGAQNSCPDEYVGVYWLKDHIQPSVLITIHDGQWKDGRHVTKRMDTNWVRGAETCYSVAFGFGVCISCTNMSIEISPNKEVDAGFSRKSLDLRARAR